MKYAKIVRYVIMSVLMTTLGWSQYGDRVTNLSSRGQVGVGSNVMITGFVIQDGASKRVLIRAVGPRLAAAPFGVSGTLEDPLLQLFNSDNVLLLSNDNWMTDDKSVHDSVGAFPLSANSRDSSIVATLSPGVYTAVVRDVSGTRSGVALLELYEIDGSNRLMNVSTRATVGTGNNLFISGVSIAKGQGGRKLLIRAIGPTLSNFGVSNALSDPTIALVDSNSRQLHANDNWSSDTHLVRAFSDAGAFALPQNSKDSVMLVDVMPGNYTILVNGVSNTTGVVLVELYDLSPEKLSTLSVRAVAPSTDTINKNPIIFRFDRVGPSTSDVDVKFDIIGSAVSGIDFENVPNFIRIPAGASSAELRIIPKTTQDSANKTLSLRLKTDYTYGIGSDNIANAMIYSNSGKLFVSTLRSTSASSTAYGNATIQLSADEKSAFINVNFSNLSSAQVVAHLQIGNDYVYNLPKGQVSNAYWSFNPTGKYSTADLISALKSGKIYVSIDTANFPEGELAGSFSLGNGAMVFNPPSVSPSVDLSKLSDIDVSRFLTQSTFGPTTKDIEEVKRMGYSAWLTKQISTPPTSHFNETWNDFNRNSTIGGLGTRDPVTQAYQFPGGPHRQSAWWYISVNGEDQLRQRVAFALSQIFVISDVSGIVASSQEGAANYYDIFVNHAFGNYRTILEEVTLSPMMGVYLSSLRNAKASNNTTPDENYAREIMQLFTIGLNELNPDGSLKLDPYGQPINTYNQDTVVQMAKVFTGWGFHNRVLNASTNANLFRGSPANYLDKMMLWPAFHDDTQKVIIGNKVLPPNQGGVKDLKDALDALFQHPNVGPFISRQLIQRLVTSNPSPAYIYRVSKVFENNGAGVRGDMAAVIRSVLLDYEARSLEVSKSESYGKLKEPLLRATSIFRAFGASSNYHNRLYIPNPESNLAQAVLRAPTVFNFFEPNFTLAGKVAESGLYAPEFQIMTDTTAITQQNFYYTYIYNNRSTTDMNQQTIGLNLTSWIQISKNPQQLVDTVSLLLTGGTMSKQNIDRIVSAISSMPTGTSTSTANDIERIRSTIYLVVTAPQGAIQK